MIFNVVGRNVSIDYRFGAGNVDRMRAYAEELVGLAPAAILAHTSPVMAALQQATHTMSLVFVNVSPGSDNALLRTWRVQAATSQGSVRSSPK